MKILNDIYNNYMMERRRRRNITEALYIYIILNFYINYCQNQFKLILSVLCFKNQFCKSISYS